MDEQSDDSSCPQFAPRRGTRFHRYAIALTPHSGSRARRVSISLTNAKYKLIINSVVVLLLRAQSPSLTMTVADYMPRMMMVWLLMTLTIMTTALMRMLKMSISRRKYYFYGRRARPPDRLITDRVLILVTVRRMRVLLKVILRKRGVWCVGDI